MHHSSWDAYKFVLDLLQPARVHLKAMLGKTGQENVWMLFLGGLGVRCRRGVTLEDLSITVTDEDIYTAKSEGQRMLIIASDSLRN